MFYFNVFLDLTRIFKKKNKFYMQVHGIVNSYQPADGAWVSSVTPSSFEGRSSGQVGWSAELVKGNLVQLMSRCRCITSHSADCCFFFISSATVSAMYSSYYTFLSYCAIKVEILLLFTTNLNCARYLTFPNEEPWSETF